MNESKMRERNGEHVFGDVGQLIFLGLFLVVWVLDSFVMHVSTFLSGFIPLYVRVVLLGIAVVGAVFFVTSGHVVVSGDSRPSRVISTGAFQYVRHPLYLGSILFYLGLAISTVSLATLLVFLAMVVFFDYIASYEERLMELRFGDEYRDYKRSTGKWVPKLNARTSRRC